jgi:hypothetical protein
MVRVHTSDYRSLDVESLPGVAAAEALWKDHPSVFVLAVAEDGPDRSRRKRHVGATHQDAVEAGQGHDRSGRAVAGSRAARFGPGAVDGHARPEGPSQVYFLVVFESEEKARAREQDTRRQEGLQAVRATMAEIFEGPPEFIDLTVVEEWTG